MRSRYDEDEAKAYVKRYGEWGEDLALRVYTSRLLGAEGALVLHGGGNTSVKSTAKEVTGDAVDVLYVKGSGWDLAAIEPEGFPACRLEPLRRYCAMAQMSDEQMVQALRSQMLDPSSPNPSVEALLHAFIGGRFVDHTHADAVLSVVDQPDGAERAREIWGDDLLLVPYVMPGFALAKKIVELADQLESAGLMVLMKHGIFTWGESARESYERMIEAVTRAEEYVERAKASVAAAALSVPPESERRTRQRVLSPMIRGALGRGPDGTRLVVEWRSEPAILSLLGRGDAGEVTQIGPATPDHVLRTKAFPLWLGDVPADEAEARAHIERGLATFAEWYEKYFADHSKRYGALTRLDRLPRLVAVRGVGVAALGKTLKEARVAGDIYAHTADIILSACSMSGYRPVTLPDLFDVEYWSLEQAKLGKAKAPGALGRKIAVVTGAARGIGRAVAERFLELGAHVMLSDRDAEALGATGEALGERFGLMASVRAADVTRGDDVGKLFDAAVRTFGGVDIVVSNAGNAPSGRLDTEAGDRALSESIEVNLLSHQRVAKAAMEVFSRQDIGGCLLFNASKSAFNPGADFGPYAVPKAGVLALMRQYAVDHGASGIRSGAVNADRIRTALFDEALVQARARARGVSPEEYFRQNLLGRETSAGDVADAFAYLASAEATTGCVITVDGGNAAAFPR